MRGRAGAGQGQGRGSTGSDQGSQVFAAELSDQGVDALLVVFGANRVQHFLDGVFVRVLHNT